MTFELSAAPADPPLGQEEGTATAKPDSGSPNPLRSNPTFDFYRFKNLPIVTVHESKHSPPRKARNAFSNGRHFLDDGRFSEAITSLGEAVAIDPEFTEALNDLAAAYGKAGRIDEAIPLLNSAIRYDPHWRLAYFNLVIAYISVNELSQAEFTARQMTEIADGPEARFVLGLSLTMEDRFTSETQAALTQAEPLFPQATLLLGRVLAGRGEIEAAKLKISAYLASPAVWNREMASEWLALLERR
jgi:tetratricopeptide (TPR) repeat protein